MRFRQRCGLVLAIATALYQTSAWAGPAVEQLISLAEAPADSVTPPEWEKAWLEAAREAFSPLFENTDDWVVGSNFRDDGGRQISIEVYPPGYWTNPDKSLLLSIQIGGDVSEHLAGHSAVLEPTEFGWFWVRTEEMDGRTVAVNNMAEEAIESLAWQIDGAVFEVRHATDVRGFARSVMQRVASIGLSGVFGPASPTVAERSSPAQTAPTDSDHAVTADGAASPSDEPLSLEVVVSVVRTDERGAIYDAILAGEPYPQSGDLVQVPGMDTVGWVEDVGFSTVAIRFLNDLEPGALRLLIRSKRPRTRPQFVLDEALLEAAASGSKSAVRTALGNGAEISALNSEGRSALHLAVENSDAAVVEMLLEQGALPNQEGLYGATPLRLAVERGSIDVLELLLRAGADVGQIPSHGSTQTSDRPDGNFYDSTALAYSTVKIQDAAVAVLLGAGADPNASDRFGLTALHLAQERSTAKLLLDAGADPNAKAHGIGGMTPLHAVTGQYGDPALSALLLARGADAEALVMNMPDGGDFEQATPLLLAAISRDSGLVDLFLAVGADPNAKLGNGDSLWDILTEEYDGYATAVAQRPGERWWLQAEFSARLQSRLFFNLLEEDPQTAAEVLNDYREAGWQPRFEHPSFSTVLQALVEDDRGDLLERVLDLGLNPRTMRTASLGDRSVFELAVSACNDRLIDLLLGYRADPGQTDTDGEPILTSANCSDDLRNKLRSVGARHQLAKDQYLEGYLAFEDRDYDGARIVLAAPQAALQPKAKSLLAIMALNGWGGEANPDEALALLTQAASLNEPLALRLLGSGQQRGLFGTRDFAAAEATYRKLSAQSSAWGDMSLAMLWADPHHPDSQLVEFRRKDALAIARSVYRLAPTRTASLFGYGYVRAALGEPVRGLSDMRTAVAIWGEEANAAHHLALGDAYHRVGLLQEALDSWQAALTRAVSPWERNYLTGRLAEVQP